ncbi:SIMPL domain-containing protein [Rubrolithibacter danxiaensis]|uniref:SIMPL domain-containing protein n=1 Tax=Rubrolithibacter danxiaensis TaxID=3390805 RepID=UPI003BF91B30
MRKLLSALALSLIVLASFAQQPDTRRRIEVIGSAEAEVTPDIIYISISLKEYFKDNSNKKKVIIEDLEKQLQSAVLNAGIPKENFTINNISSYNYTWEKKKNPDFLASKQYRIKVTDLTKLNQIIGSVDSRGIEYTNIDSYDYSKIESLKKDLKVKALQAAKAKAAYLAEAVNEKIGSALEIQEINNESYPQPIYRSNYMMKADAAEAGAMPDVDFKKIKLNYQMRAVFELK